MDRDRVRERMLANLKADGIPVVTEDIEQIFEASVERVSELEDLARKYGCAGDPPDTVRRLEPARE